LSPIQSLHEHAVIAIRVLETKEPKLNVSSELVLLHEPPKSNPMGAATRKKIELGNSSVAYSQTAEK
jgi:hypothetical protein